MATTTHDDDRTHLVDILLDSLATLQRNTTPQEDLRAMAADLLDHANDLDKDERLDDVPWDDTDVANDEGDRAFDIAREQGDLR